jgi:hypothetical protein
MINLIIYGSDSGKAQAGTCKLKFKKIDLPENYINSHDNNELPEFIKKIAREMGCILIVRTSKYGSKPGSFYLKGNFDTDYEKVERTVLNNYNIKKYKKPKCWLSKDRMW